MTRRGRGGFTLLEVILAVTLAVAIVGAAFAFYRRAMDARASILDGVELALAERGIMDRLTQELRGAVVDPFASSGLEGGDWGMRFATTAVPGPAAWAVRRTTEDQVPPERDLQVLGYRLRVVEDEQGVEQVVGLERTSQTLVSAPTVEEGAEVAVTLLTARIRHLYVRYWDGAAWGGSWPGGDLPSAVEINLGERPLPEGVLPEDYPYPTFRRVVFIPGGAKAVEGTTVRGLGEGL